MRNPQVCAACRDPNSASELRRLADSSDHKLQIMALDVTDPASVNAAAAELDGQAIDLLLNNAGVMGTRGQTIGNMDYEAWAKVLDANTLGPMRVSEAFVDSTAVELINFSNHRSESIRHRWLSSHAPACRTEGAKWPLKIPLEAATI